MASEITPFKISINKSEIDSLRDRLANTRWPEAELVEDWSQGVPTAWLQDIVAHWQSGYDWFEREALLNRFAQYKTEIGGLNIHFIHQRSSHPKARPLLITHGWPGSIVEFQKIIAPLTDPTSHGGTEQDAFHVVCPSLPGFGFSDKPKQTGWSVEKIARTFASLMNKLGYERYFAQGGDWGSAVTQSLGWQDPEHCAAIHVTLAMSTRPRPQDPPTPEEQRALDGLAFYQRWDSGYSKQQSTRPQTLAYALNDSPIGQAAWILEKFWAWTDCGGDPLNVLRKDELLDNVMLYWLNQTAASSARIYWESFLNIERHAIEVPTGVAVYPEEIVPPVRQWMEAGDYKNIVHWAEMPRGGHFAAFEQPELYVKNIRDWAQVADAMG